ncbi:fucolectin-6-like [Patiria miniata]|uniref:Fucolectin tachylectin-4 pentraxin-1 domain-containing protein n=1 Tax=Patiria miniata TaxID=46514 RepID=A0A914ANX2_PATMI|nr:fucolectin-6-like [Patiria miniata]
MGRKSSHILNVLQPCKTYHNASIKMPRMLKSCISFNIKDVRFVIFLTQVCCLQRVSCDLQALSVIGKPASQSMGYYPAGNAVDNDINTFSHGADGGDPHPWWRVDLLNEHCLGEITVTTRQGCCGKKTK